MSDFQAHTEHTARKQHRCFACGDSIEPGERYARWRGVFEGNFFDSAQHARCDGFYSLFDFDCEGVFEGFALETAREYTSWGDNKAHARRDGESARDFVDRVMTLREQEDAAKRLAKKA